jgi:beta-lactamase class A
MTHSRRGFLKTAAATAAFASVPRLGLASPTTGQPITPDQIIGLFTSLPGETAIKIFVPGASFKPAFVAQLNSQKRLFAASANKTFALCKALQQVDSPDVVERLETTPLKLDASIWSKPGSPFFNPPHLKGTISERATLEAMIMNSDNTATDMIFKLAGVDNIRSLIASLGLTETVIPDSTRAFSAYLFGAKNYKTITWDQLEELLKNGSLEHNFLNDVETLASSADDFVSYYSQALPGALFEHAHTLNEFRRILTLCDFIYLIPLPLGASAYAKSGNADVPGFHARSIAGGLFVSNHWVYFAFIINWSAPEAEDHQTVHQFYSAINTALSLVMNSLS